MLRPAHFLVLLGLICCTAPAYAGKHPEPSIYPIAWELKFTHAMPKRVVVDTPGAGPVAYWYLPYTVTNLSNQEQMFLPLFEMLTDDGRVIRSDNHVPLEVFEKIKATEGDNLLVPANKISGVLRIGEDQAKNGVAIWAEPQARIGRFSIFVGGLSGEFVTATGEDGKPILDSDNNPILLSKTLEIDYAIYGDEVKPGLDEVHALGEKWIMR